MNDSHQLDGEGAGDPFAPFSPVDLGHTAAKNDNDEVWEPVLPAPVILAITPEAGSIGGGARVTITGSGFLPGVTVTLGGIVLAVRPDHRDPMGTILYGEAPAHGTGAVALVVTNPGGRADT